MRFPNPRGQYQGRRSPSKLEERGPLRILSAGNGVDFTPYTVAHSGCDVTALDVAPSASQHLAAARFGPWWTTTPPRSDGTPRWERETQPAASTARQEPGLPAVEGIRAERTCTVSSDRPPAKVKATGLRCREERDGGSLSEEANLDRLCATQTGEAEQVRRGCQQDDVTPRCEDAAHLRTSRSVERL
jgi:hypothetical protein